MSSVAQQLLPGGLYREGRLLRQFHFKPLVGELEVMFSEARTQAQSFPELVSEVLLRSLKSLGGQAPSRKLVRQLSVGDRQFLILRLAAHIDDSENWISAACRNCGEKMDLAFRYSELPVKTANANYPAFETMLAERKIRVRVPTGEDQEAIATIEDDSSAFEQLLQQLVSSTTHKDLQFNQQELEQLEELIEDASPEVGTQLLTQCPHCDTENTVEIDIYRFLKGGVDQLLLDVHEIAMHYHWSEQEILRLPRERRKRYLSLIDRARGMVSH